MAREENRVSIEKLFKAQKRFYNASYDDKRQKDFERGNATFSDNTDLPFGYSVRASLLITIRDVADALGCSVDFLLGRTDRMEIVSESDAIREPEAVSESGTFWHPVSEEPPTGVDLVWLDAHGYSDTGMYYGSGTIESVCTIQWPEARWWARLPEDK